MKKTSSIYKRGVEFKLSSIAELSAIEPRFSRPGYKFSHWIYGNGLTCNDQDMVTLSNAKSQVSAIWRKTSDRSLMLIAIDGTSCYFKDSDIGEELIYSDYYSSNKYAVTQPYSLCTEIDKSNKLAYVCNLDSTISALGEYAFYDCPNLKSVQLNGIKTIGDFAFSDCTGLTEISVEKATQFDSNMFYGSSTLNVSSFYVNNDMFHSLDSKVVVDNTETNLKLAVPTLTEISNDNIEAISQYALQNNTNLNQVELTNVISVDSAAFAYCTEIENLNFPKLTDIGSGVFQSCSSLTSICISELTSIPGFSFRNCVSLNELNLPKIRSIGQFAFQNCVNLLSIVLSAQLSVVQLYDINAFKACNENYVVYVKSDAVYQKYLEDSIWNQISSHISALNI